MRIETKKMSNGNVKACSEKSQKFMEKCETKERKTKMQFKSQHCVKVQQTKLDWILLTFNYITAFACTVTAIVNFFSSFHIYTVYTIHMTKLI